MFKLLCFMLMTGVCRLQAQINLIPNPGFELKDSCSKSYVFDSSRTNFPSAKDWFKPTLGTPDYSNEDCYIANGGTARFPSGHLGYQNPRNGKAMAGIIASTAHISLVQSAYQEYISSRLLNPLIAGSYYFVSFYINLRNSKSIQTQNTIYGNSTVAALISDGITFNNTLNSLNWLHPQITRPIGSFVIDTLNWVQTSGLYKAKGGEQWITIGDFGIQRDDTLSNISKDSLLSIVKIFSCYYFIDDVSVTLFNTTSNVKDTTICLGKIIAFTKRANWDSCLWYDGTNDSLKTFAASGNYWVTNYYQGLEVTDTIKVSLIDTTQSIITQTGFCAGNSAILQARASSTYLWNTGSTNPQIETTTAGLYTVMLNNRECLVTDSFYVSRHTLPVITSLSDTVVCFDQVAQILLDAGQFKSYLWKPTSETTRTIYSNAAQVYLLTVTDSNNCSMSKQVAVMETCPEFVFIPNAFTPNGDGVNDAFQVSTRSLESFELAIYNRWGQLVFETMDATKSWDGSEAPSDAYVYLVTYKVTGKPLQTTKGTVSLVR